MAKQSMKQQIYQSIANSQVKQVMAQKREQEIAQLQAQFNAWNKQQDEKAALQAAYDEWNATNPIEQPTVNQIKAENTTAQRIPSLADSQPKKREQTEMEKHIAEVTKQAKEKRLREREQKLQQLEQIEASKKSGKTEKKADLEGYFRQQQEENILASPKKVTNNAEKWLSPDYKLTDEDKKAAKAYAQAELQKLDYDSNKKPILKTPEERQHYADMVNLLNKTNAFTNAMEGVIKQPAALGRAVRDAGRNVTNQITGLGAALGDKFGLTEGATKRHNDKVAERDAFYKQNDEAMRQALANAKTQNPLATTAGEIGGQVGMYMLTNPAFDALGATAGLGKAGSFALNQVGQNAQDLALDTIPMLNDYLEGGVTNEERKELLKNIGLNAAGNLAMGAAGEGISALAKNQTAKKAANEAFRANALEGADKLAKLANMEDVDNVVRNATKQAEEAAQNIENLSKQYPVSEIASFENADNNFYKIPDDIKNIAANNMSDVKNMDSVATVKGQLFKGEGSLIDKVSAFFNSRGGKAHNDLLGDVDLTRRGVKDSISHNKLTRRKVDAFAAVPDVIEKGKVVAYEPNWKGRNYDTALIVAPTKVENPDGSVEDFITGVIVRRDKGTQRFYTHDAVSINRKELSLETGTPSQGQNTRGDSSFSVYSILRKLADDKASIPENAKISVNPLENISEEAAKTIENAAKSQPNYDPEVQEKLLSDFEEIYNGMDNMNRAAINSGDAKAIEKFEKLQKAVFDYENTIWKNGDPSDINKAKKAADAARQGFIRQMKKIDPSYTGDLTGTKLGNAEYRIPKGVSDAEAEELVNDWVKQDIDNPNRFVEDVSKRNKGNTKKVEGANPLQFFAEEAKPDINETIRQANKNILNGQLQANAEMQRLLKDEDFLAQATENARQSGQRLMNPEDDIRRLSGERAYYEKRLDANKTAGEKEDEALDALTNYVNSQRNGGGSNTPPRRPVSETPTEDITPTQPRSGGPTPPSGGNGEIPPERWATSKFRTNTAEKLGYADNMPLRNYAYRVYSEAEQKADAIARYQDSLDVAQDLLNKGYDDFDEVDIKAAFSKMQELQDAGDRASLRMLDRLGQKTAAVQRQSGRVVQASAEFTRNTLGGALEDAHRAQDDLILEPWRSRNVKAREGNSRIAKALADMGHKPNSKIRPELTHDQIKNGVIAELNREVGSVEKYFNDNDIEFLTQLAEDKSIPVWQITSEIEHKLNTGNWYTLDESIDIPKPTNRKLQNALNSLVTEQIRAEKPAPTLKQIIDEVRSTLGKESADFDGQFDDNDIEYLANLINNGATKEELAQALDLKMATGSFGISDETLQEVNNIFKQISNYDSNSKQFVEGQAEAYRLLANEIVPDATPLEKFEAWRYLAMLGNPKTMLRNFVGNQTFGAVTGISNNVAAIAEAGIDKASKALGGNGIQRTKSVLNPISDSGLIKAAAEDADASRYRQIIGSKYEKMDKDALRQSRSVFKSKLAQLYEKVTDAGISDYQAVKNKFSTSLAGYLKANGYDTNIFKAEEELARLKGLRETRLLSDAENQAIKDLTKDVEALEKARDYALKQAEYATFHEDNDVAKLLTKWSRDARNSDNKAAKALGYIIEGTVPFKKTPANVLKSGLEYSPLGAIDSIKQTGKLIYENTGKRAGNLADTYLNSRGKEVTKTLASDVIDSWAKTLTGTGLTALGFYLYNKGILHSSDPDTKYQDQLEGHQNYAIEINGKSYTIDWAAPTVMPLMVGAEIAKLWDSTGKGDEDFLNNIDDYVAAANRIADPLVETSMLSGVKDTLETAANAAQYNENLNIPALVAYNALTGYATQGVPTIAGQVARTIDPTRRSTYTDKEGVAGVLDKQLKKQMNKIPGLSMLNQPYVDTYGREQQNSPFNNAAGNLAYQMFSPGYLSDINETEADRISREAYEIGKSESTLPEWQSKFKDAEGNRVSPEEYTKAARAYGEAEYSIREALANDEWFNGLEDPAKEEIVKEINTISKHVGNAAIDPEYSKDSAAYNAYKDGGIDGLLDYYKGKQAKSVAKESGFSSTSNASKSIQADVEAGNMDAAQEKIDAATYLQNNGLTKPGPSYTYYNAQEKIPSLTPEEFTKTYKAIDSNGNQGITQDELINYLDKSKVSETEGKKLWSAYGSSKWKAIPKLENGTWKKGK
ncbi:hypothetical protein [Butyrivibrio sp. AE2032]|uniref:LPD3 domain-containing protein n=1 Tax=Butyrivibrio sp. AE2032 TaxID=1458463 RepID=UPI00054D109E|nr:hypothetical protein [Butyrivibrio sp. AE2032]